MRTLPLASFLVLALFAAACESGGGGGGGDPDPTPTVFLAETFEDGDFSAAPAWSIQDSCAGGTCVAEVTDEGAMTKVAHVSRTGSNSNGGLYAIHLAVDHEVGSGPLQMSYRVFLHFDQLGNGSNDCSEWAGHIWVGLELDDDTTTTYHAAHSRLGGPCPAASDVWDIRQVNTDVWSVFTSDISAALDAAGKAPAARVTSVMVGGNGWDFDVKYDDLQLGVMLF